MKTIVFRFLFLTFLVYSALTGTSVAESRFHEVTTGIRFPDVLGSLSYRGKVEYPNPALGVSVRYELGKDVKADVYIYNMNMQGIGDNEVSKPVIQQLVQAVSQVYALEKRGNYANVKPYPDGKKLKFRFRKIRNKQFTWTALSYSQVGPHSPNKASRTSYIYLTSKKNQFIKVRYTYLKSHGNIGYQVFNSFMKALAREL